MPKKAQESKCTLVFPDLSFQIKKRIKSPGEAEIIAFGCGREAKKVPTLVVIDTSDVRTVCGFWQTRGSGIEH